jgi:4-hydroxy-tetrahydrodipicolinate reductase
MEKNLKKLLISGVNGRMGQVVASCAPKFSQLQVAAGVDKNVNATNKFPVFEKFSEVSEIPDVLIDFSHPSLVRALLEFAAKNEVPAVICTTGLTSKHVKLIEEAATKVPIFLSPNMSLGVNLLIELVRRATKVLGGNFDIEIIEKHHNQKVDSPSGTALAIANAAAESMSKDTKFVYGRTPESPKRGQNEIGIHSIRGGSIVGEHSILFCGKDEVLEIKHSAASKEIFAIGALKAAEFLIGKAPKLYNMSNLINEI